MSAVLNTWLFNWILFRRSLLQEPCLGPPSLPVCTRRLAGCAGARSAAVSAQEGWRGPLQNATRENELLAWLWGLGSCGCGESPSRGKRWQGRRLTPCRGASCSSGECRAPGTQFRVRYLSYCTLKCGTEYFLMCSQGTDAHVARGGSSF